MGDERNCGYCRESGHRADKCRIKEEQIISIRLHLYNERAALHNIMLENGLGVGAIIRPPGQEPHVIRSVADSLKAYANHFIEWYNIKYERSVRSSLKSYSGINHNPQFINNKYVRFNNQTGFYIVCSPLSNLANDTYAVISFCALANPPLNNPQSMLDKNSYYGSRSCEILSPSDSTDVDNNMFMEQFRLHSRLGKSRDGYGVAVMPLQSRPS